MQRRDVVSGGDGDRAERDVERALGQARQQAVIAGKDCLRADTSAAVAERGHRLFFHTALTREAARSRPARLKWSHLLNTSATTLRRVYPFHPRRPGCDSEYPKASDFT